MSGREGLMDSSVTEPSSKAGRWAVGLVGGDWELGELAPHFAGSIRVDRCPEGWELMSDAFPFLAIQPNWHSLYAALDTILRDRRTGGEGGLTTWANVPAAKVRLFRRTANSSRAVGAEARHGPDYVAPRHPMAFTEAEELVGHVVNCWLDELGRVSSVPGRQNLDH